MNSAATHLQLWLGQSPDTKKGVLVPLIWGGILLARGVGLMIVGDPQTAMPIFLAIGQKFGFGLAKLGGSERSVTVLTPVFVAFLGSKTSLEYSNIGLLGNPHVINHPRST